MELKHLEMVSALNNRLGVNGQLMNLNKECAEMQVVVSDLFRGLEVPRNVFVECLADLYVMLNAAVLLYNVSPDEINFVVDAKLSRSLGLLPGQPAMSGTESGVVSEAEPEVDSKAVPGADAESASSESVVQE